MSVHNITDTNNKLNSFRNNMKWDLGFMLKLISLDYLSLGDITVANKKKLLTNIEDLIKSYKETSLDQKQIEDY